MSPLFLDISSAGQYLVNSCDARLRIDFSPASLLINTSDDEKYSYKIQSIKLWVKKITPNNNALLSMNRSLLTNNSNLEYVFQRPIIQTYVFPSNQDIISLDNIFSGLLPNKLHLCILPQSSANGAYKENGAYFTHGNISSLQLEVNGHTVSSFQCDFKNDQIARLFHHNIIDLQSNDNLLTLKNFAKGRTIYSWNLTPAETGDTLPVDRSGNLRLSLRTCKPNTENLILYVIGLTTALIEIDAGRRVKCSYLM